MKRISSTSSRQRGAEPLHVAREAAEEAVAALVGSMLLEQGPAIRVIGRLEVCAVARQH
jgi:hypothetical protein